MDHWSLSAHGVCFRSVHQGPEAQGPIACITVGNRGSAQLSLPKATAACVAAGDQEKRSPGTLVHAVLAGVHAGRGQGGRGSHREGGAASFRQGAVSGSLYWAGDKTHLFWPLLRSWLEPGKPFLSCYYFKNMYLW